MDAECDASAKRPDASDASELGDSACPNCKRSANERACPHAPQLDDGSRDDGSREHSANERGLPPASKLDDSTCTACKRSASQRGLSPASELDFGACRGNKHHFIADERAGGKASATQSCCRADW